MAGTCRRRLVDGLATQQLFSFKPKSQKPFKLGWPSLISWPYAKLFINLVCYSYGEISRPRSFSTDLASSVRSKQTSVLIFHRTNSKPG